MFENRKRSDTLEKRYQKEIKTGLRFGLERDCEIEQRKVSRRKKDQRPRK